MEIKQEHTKQNQVDAKAIILVGKKGSGKSKLGNFLLGEEKFLVSSSFSSATETSQSEHYVISRDDRKYEYDLVDTSGVFDTDNLDEKALEELTRTVRLCYKGIKAILLVFETARFTEEQIDVVQRIKVLFGEDVLNYMIIVFTKCNKEQTIYWNNFEKDWNDSIRTFVNSIGGRWGILPNPDIFDENNEVFKDHIKKVEDLIMNLQDEYIHEIFKKHQVREGELQKLKQENVDHQKILEVENNNFKALQEDLHCHISSHYPQPRTFTFNLLNVNVSCQIL